MMHFKGFHFWNSGACPHHLNLLKFRTGKQEGVAYNRWSLVAKKLVAESLMVNKRLLF